MTDASVPDSAAVAFDLSRVSFMDSSGLAFLIGVGRPKSRRSGSPRHRDQNAATHRAGRAGHGPRVGAMSTERWLSPVPESVPESRRFVHRDHLRGLDHEGIRQVALMVSEIATNCVVHARTATRIAITRHEGRVRVEVTDRSPRRARPVHAGPDDARRRGLMIVSSLADDWGDCARTRPPGTRPSGSRSRSTPPRRRERRAQVARGGIEPPTYRFFRCPLVVSGRPPRCKIPGIAGL